MQIKIIQKKVKTGDRYEIYIEGRETYMANTEWFRWLPEIELFKIGTDGPRYIIRKKRTFFKTSYNLSKWDDSVLEFRTRSAWKGHYFCFDGQDYFELFAHRGWKFSVYKNERQIAFWDKNSDSLFNGHKYIIIADKDADFELLIAFCLIIDNSQSAGNGDNGLMINLGNIGKQARKFDETWQPKF